jgi:type III restriction enzyme
MAPSTPPSSNRNPADLRGQAKVIYEVRRLVDEWRGFDLGRAADPYPKEPPRYEVAKEGERPLTETTLSLLLHWFRREPHTLGSPPSTFAFKYWPHQRRLVETFIYLHEVRGVRRTEELYNLTGVEPLGPQRDPWAKLGGQLATGSGKTKMMALLIAWSYLNAVREPGSGLGFGRHSILIAPGLFVRDRLLQDFAPKDKASVFFSDPVVPPEFESIWRLKVYSPDTCPRTLDPEDGALVVTNYHQLLRTGDPVADAAVLNAEQRQLGLLFESGDPSKLEAVESPLMERFSKSRGLLVLNDEAHHVWDETGHAKFEQKAKEKAKVTGEDPETAMAWIRCIRRLNGSENHEGRVALQADLSATLFEEQGAKQKAGKTEFKQADPFRHTVVHYGLAEGIGDGIVKKPVLERVVAKNKKTGEPLPLINVAATNAWEKYSHLLTTGIERWKKVRDQLADEGDPRKPVLFVLCADRNEAHEVANFLAHGQAVREDLSHLVPSGYLDPQTDEALFIEKSADGTVHSTVVEIHIGQKEESNEADWEKVRQAVNAIDQDQIPDPDGARDADGRLVMVANPYNVVVSVMMLKEGWDVRNVKVIVPLRPCDSRTLTEQTLGRGLRKMHAPILDDEGAAELQAEDLFVIEHPSFQTILDQIRDIIELKSSDEIEHAREYVPIVQNPDQDARNEVGVRLVRFEGVVQAQRDWRKNFDLSKVSSLTPKIGWMEEIPETEISTFLKKALAKVEEDGQTFSVPANPSYRDFDHVLEFAFTVPLLKELRTSYQHKTAVKGIVQEFLEKKTFALPAGIPISFTKIIEAGDGAKIALGNLARPEVVEGVKKALLAPLHEALTSERPTAEAVLSRRKSSELSNYQAVKKHVLQAKKSSFTTAALDSGDELRVAALLDRAPDIVGWVYNHRSGVGYSIEYDWQGYQSRYFPDFIVRAKSGAVFHNFIVEVKGRMDERDKAKARRGRRYCEMLTEYDNEPWHYILLIENASEGRDDISWWEARSSGDKSAEIFHVLKHHESLALVPPGGSSPPKAALFEVVDSVAEKEKFQSALPVFDLAVAAGTFGNSQSPEPMGWARVQPSRPLDKSMFLAKVVGQSMEDGISNGSWCVFRRYAAGSAPSSTALDGKRVVVQLREDTDPETGGQYTLKRWRVAQLGQDGGVVEIELRPDNPNYKTKKYSAKDGDLRAVAEFVEVVA